MTRLILILSFWLCSAVAFSQVMPADSILTKKSPSWYFEYTPKNVENPDTNKVKLFDINAYLHVLTSDSIQEITDSLSSYTWVIRRYLRHEEIVYPLIVLPNSTPNRNPAKGED